MGKYSGIGISGTASYAPKKQIMTRSVMDQYGFTEDYISNIGIDKIHVSGDREYPTDMAIYAAKDAIADAGIDPADIDVVIYSYGGFPEYFMWAEYARVQHEIGAVNAVSLRYDQACNAQIIALEYAVF